jgi:drug/metabolite transporter (DMT)-like permease
MATTLAVQETSKLSRHTLKVILAFALVYVFWGSTYMAIRIGVEHVPPALMGGVRFLIAGAIMLGWCVLTRKKIALSGADALRLFAIGLLLLTGGNVLLIWSERFIPSGLAALIVAVVPLWVAILEGAFGTERLSGRGWIGILLGIAGLLVLLWPKLTSGDELGRHDLLVSMVLMIGSLSWAIGSIFSRRTKLGVGPFAATGWEMIFAGAFNGIVGLVLGEHHRAHWAVPGILAIAYLVTFGSLVGFTAYVWLLEHVQTSKVATYAYVNPIVAVFLGWLIGHESLDRYMWMGMLVIVSSVILVTSSKLKSGATQASQDIAACESAGD